MRRFYLENGRGDTLPLQGGQLFLQQVEGLGSSHAADYTRAGSCFYVPHINDREQNIITGRVVASGHGARSRLLRWVRQADPLRLVYQPDPYTHLLMDVDMQSMGQSESVAGAAEIPLVLAGRCPFYRQEDAKVTLLSDGTGSHMMRFPFRFPFVFSAQAAASVAEVYVDGDYPASVQAVLRGPLQSPVLEAVDADGACMGRLDLSALSLSEGECAEYSSRPGEEQIVRVSGGQRENLLPLLNLAHNNFFTLPPGQQVQLKLHAKLKSGATPSTHTVYIRQYQDV